MASDNPNHEFKGSIGETDLLFAEFEDGTPFQVFIEVKGQLHVAGEGETPEEALTQVGKVLSPVGETDEQ